MFSADPPPPAPALPDDASSGRALGRALAALGAVVAVVLAIFFWQARPGAPAGPGGAPGQVGAATGPFPPDARFTDVTAAAGIRFVHTSGAYGEKLLPETMGGGVAFFDADADGDADLLFVNGTTRPGHAPPDQPRPTSALYLNDGRGRFTDVTAGSGVDVPLDGMGVAVGDYDGDGLTDVYLTAVGPNRLLKNLGEGRFRDVTADAGVAGAPDAWSTSAAWLDHDRDGDLDLFVCSYVKWSPEIDLALDYRLPGIGRAYGPPIKFEGTVPFLFRNDGAGRFREVAAEAGLHVTNRATGTPLAKSLGVAPLDLDDDGWLDLVVANDTVQNFVFRNQRNGTFREVGAAAGLAFDSFGGTRGAMGIDGARLAAASDLAIAIGNFANEMTALYVAQPGSGAARETVVQFADQALGQGIGPASRLSLTFGVFFFDYDLDGWLDLLTVNGHLDEGVERLLHGQRYRQAAQLFWSRGAAGGFAVVEPEQAGPDLFQPIVGRGSAFADMDGDGDLDVVVTQINGPPLLLRNDQRLGHHWVRLKLSGRAGNRDAIGAAVELRAGGRAAWRQVMPTRGYLSQSELSLTFGLGSGIRVDEAVIRWPDGARQVVRDLKVDAVNAIEAP